MFITALQPHRSGGLGWSPLQASTHAVPPPFPYSSSGTGPRCRLPWEAQVSAWRPPPMCMQSCFGGPVFTSLTVS